MSETVRVYESKFYINEYMLDDLHRAWDECATINEVPYKHRYLTSGFSIDASRRHICLKSGEWCWQNFKEHPRDLVDYIRAKLTLDT